MNIVHLVDSVDRVNFGVWNAAIATASSLRNQFGVESRLLFAKATREIPSLITECVADVSFVGGIGQLRSATRRFKCSPEETVFVSHGCWQRPTLWGMKLANMGFKWVFTPHGMLEPWSLAQRQLIKSLYFKFRESPAIQCTNLIRAVSTPEGERLQRMFPNLQVVTIPNCVRLPNDANDDSKSVDECDRGATKFLFLGRLHQKKCVVELAKAFTSSPLKSRADVKLIIAGPDDGELSQLLNLKDDSEADNLLVCGPVYGEQKHKLFREADYFILPSQSEGLPTSVLEAMSYQCVAIISEGCNFPEAFSSGLALPVSPDIESIRTVLVDAVAMPLNSRKTLSKQSRYFVEQNYGTDQVAALQHTAYKQLLS